MPMLPESRPANKPKLLDQIRELMRAKYYAIRTEEAYVGWIRRFILFSGKRHPSEMGGREVARFLSHLANQGDLHARAESAGAGSEESGRCDAVRFGLGKSRAAPLFLAPNPAVFPGRTAVRGRGRRIPFRSGRTGRPWRNSRPAGRSAPGGRIRG